MRRSYIFASLVLAVTQTAGAQTASRFLYAINSDVAGSIAAFAMDSSTGTLTPLPGSPYRLSRQPGPAAMDPTARFLFIGERSSSGGAPFTLEVFGVDPNTGALKAAPGSPFQLVAQATAVAVDASGRFLYVAHSGAEAVHRLSRFTVDALLGALTPAGQQVFKTLRGQA
jgi:6-phosphogluconolactonase